MLATRDADTSNSPASICLTTLGLSRRLLDDAINPFSLSPTSPCSVKSHLPQQFRCQPGAGSALGRVVPRRGFTVGSKLTPTD